MQASQPLEDVDFSKGPGVEVEIPEEGWEELAGHRPDNPPTSGSGSEIDSVSVCAVHRLDLSEKEREDHVRLPVHEPLPRGQKSLPVSREKSLLPVPVGEQVFKKCLPYKPLQKGSPLRLKRELGYSLEVLNMQSTDAAATSDSKVGTIGTIVTPGAAQSLSNNPSPPHLHHKSRNCSAGRTNSNNRNSSSSPRIKSSSKENRLPAARKSSECSTENMQSKNTENNDIRMTEDGDLHGYVSREDDDCTKDISLTFDR